MKTLMPKTKTYKARNNDSLEQKLWNAADKLRKNIKAKKYQNNVLGLIFLKTSTAQEVGGGRGRIQRDGL